jgi:hypothetical protein
MGPGSIEPGSSLVEKLTWLQTNAQSNTAYTFEVSADENIDPINLSYNARTNINITLIGIGGERTISLASNGSMFYVGNGVTLALGNNITLQGKADNNAPLIRINTVGTLVMDAGSKITGNAPMPTFHGGGVDTGGGTFIMNGGEISGNTSSAGGGVYVGFGTFTMNGGAILDNTATSFSGGGGVYVTYLSGSNGGIAIGGTFTMNGGTISGNTASNPSGKGGGVSVAVYGTFTMNGGTISGNTGGGVYVYDGTFRIVTGTIYGSNEANTSLRNRAATEGAALLNNGTAERGTFSGSTWNSNGTLDTTNNTIRVVGGNLQ